MSDRRETELHLAAAGRRLVDRVTARRRQDLAAIASRMSAEEVRAAAEILEVFAAAAEGSSADADFFGWERTDR